MNIKTITLTVQQALRLAETLRVFSPGAARKLSAAQFQARSFAKELENKVTVELQKPRRY